MITHMSETWGCLVIGRLANETSSGQAIKEVAYLEYYFHCIQLCAYNNNLTRTVLNKHSGINKNLRGNHPRNCTWSNRPYDTPGYI